MHGVIPPLPNTPSWRGDRLKKSPGANLPLTRQELTTGGGVKMSLY
jgi:hypothetical protein